MKPLKGELIINNTDAWATWRLAMQDTALAALLQPPPAKQLPTSSCRLEDGIRAVLANPRTDSRDITLPLALIHKTGDALNAALRSLCQTLAAGRVNIRTRHTPGVVFRTVYKSCSAYSQRGGLALITLRLTEPNPADRRPTLAEQGAVIDGLGRTESDAWQQADTRRAGQLQQQSNVRQPQQLQ